MTGSRWSTSASALTVLDLQDGDDTVNLAPTAQDLDLLPGAVEVYGGAGFDTVNLRDDNQPRGDWYTITNSTVSRALFGGLTYDADVEFLALWTGDGDDWIDVESTSASALTVLDLQDGDDTVSTLLPPPRTWTCCPVRWKSTAEPVSIRSISGMTTSRGAIGTQSPIVPSAGPSSAGLTYDADVEFLALWTGDGDDWIDVESTSASALTVLDLQDGDDTVNLAPTAQDLDLLPGAVEVYGGAGFDTVNLRDDNQPRGDWYTITDSTLTRALFGGLTYDADVELLALWTGMATIWSTWRAPRSVPSRCLTFRTATIRLTLLPPPRTWTCCPVRWESTAEPGSIRSISGMTTSRRAMGTQSPMAPSAGPSSAA